MDEVKDGFGQVLFSSDMISINVILLAIQGITRKIYIYLADFFLKNNSTAYMDKLNEEKEGFGLILFKPWHIFRKWHWKHILKISKKLKLPSFIVQSCTVDCE